MLSLRHVGSIGVALALVVAVTGACGGSDAGVGSGNGGIGSPCATDVATACGAKKCDAALGCVQCLADTDCGAGDPFCIRGSCEACRTNADCGAAAPSCWPGDNKCHPACTSNAQCTGQGGGDPRLCDTTTGACVGCNANTDCAAPRPICDAVSRRCVGCASNADCGAAAPRCDLAEGKCVQCLTGADCPAATPRCDPEEHVCRAAGCTSDAQCAAPTPKCNVGSGSCVQCVVRADCAGTPATPVCKDTRCVQCADDTDCPAATPKCKDRVCTTAK